MFPVLSGWVLWNFNRFRVKVLNNKFEIFNYIKIIFKLKVIKNQ